MSQCGNLQLLCKWREDRSEVSKNLMDEVPSRIQEMNQFHIAALGVVGLGLVWLLTR